MKMKKNHLIACLAALATATPGFAASIAVTNYSFEDPGTGKTSDLTTVPGWDSTSTDNIGVEPLGSTGHYAPAVTEGSYNLYTGSDR